MGRVSTTILATALAVSALVGCSDDDVPEVRSNDEFQEHADELCADQARRMAESADETDRVMPASTSEIETITTSDAEISSFLRTEYIPRTRAIIRNLNRFGFPPARDAELRTALQSVLNNSLLLETSTIEWIDDNRADRFDEIDADDDGIPDDDFLRENEHAFASVDLADCSL